MVTPYGYNLMFLFVWEAHSAVCKSYAWLCGQVSLLMVIGGTIYEAKDLMSVGYTQANALTPISLQSLSTISCNRNYVFIYLSIIYMHATLSVVI